MTVFLDTSSLFKLYHQEADTEALDDLFATGSITGIFLSEIAKVEFTSTIWKKVRIQAMNEAEARIVLNLFEADFEKYQFISIDSLLLEQARMLLTKYGTQGLRTLDSIQLATAVSLTQQVAAFFTADKLLKKLFEAENLATELPAQ